MDRRLLWWRSVGCPGRGAGRNRFAGVGSVRSQPFGRCRKFLGYGVGVAFCGGVWNSCRRNHRLRNLGGRAGQSAFTKPLAIWSDNKNVQLPRPRRVSQRRRPRHRQPRLARTLRRLERLVYADAGHQRRRQRRLFARRFSVGKTETRTVGRRLGGKVQGAASKIFQKWAISNPNA